VSGLGPPILKSSIRSWNWPWMSPQTVTGHFCRGIKSVASGHFIERGVSRTTGCTLDSSCRTSRAYSMASQHGCPTPHSITRAVDDAENGARRGQRRTAKPAQARATKRQSCLPGGKPPSQSSMQLQEGGCSPYRRVSGRRPRPAVCSSSSSRSNRRVWGSRRARSGRATRRRVPFRRPPCWCP